MKITTIKGEDIVENKFWRYKMAKPKKRFTEIRTWEVEQPNRQFIVSYIISFIIIFFLSIKSNILFLILAILPLIGAFISAYKIKRIYEEV